MTCAAAPTILKATLHSQDGMDLRLVHYPAGLTQTGHRHEDAQLSILLAGTLREVTRRRDVETARRSHGLKPCGQSHAAQFGPHGALMLSMTLDRDPATPRQAAEWLPNSSAMDALIAGLLATDDAAVRADMAQDLRGMLEAGATAPTGRGEHDAARRLKQALDARPDGGRIDDLARELGLHRVHLSRCFTETYGLAPSLYRARVMTARALTQALRERDGLAAVAADAGFADQSHMARTSRRQIGVPLSRVRELFARATSVQALAA